MSNRLILRSVAVAPAPARNARVRISESFPSGGYDSRSAANAISRRCDETKADQCQLIDVRLRSTCRARSSWQSALESPTGGNFAARP